MSGEDSSLSALIILFGFVLSKNIRTCCSIDKRIRILPPGEHSLSKSTTRPKVRKVRIPDWRETGTFKKWFAESHASAVNPSWMTILAPVDSRLPVTSPPGASSGRRGAELKKRIVH